MTLCGLLRIRNSASPAFQPVLELLLCAVDRLAKRLLVLTLLLVLASSVLTGVAPLLLKSVIDGLEPDDGGTFQLILIYLIAAYIFVHWLSKSLGELRGMSYGWADQRVQRRLSDVLFRHVMSLPLHFHLDRKTGALNQTLTNGLVGYRMVLHHIMLTVLPVVIELGTMGAVLVLLDQAVFLVIIGISVLLYTLAFWVGVKRIGSPSRAASNANIEANAVLTDSILNYETVKCFDAEAQIYGRFDEALIRSESEWKQLYERKLESGLIVAAIFALTLGVSLYVAALEVQVGRMSVGEFVLVNAYIFQIMRPVEMIGFAFRDIAQGLAFVEKMSELYSQSREIDVVGSRTILPAGSPKLVFDQVSYSYHSDHQVLKDVSFTVPPDETVAVVGRSGSGKSSLTRLLVRLIEPNKGQIFLSGVPLSDIPRSALRNAIAMVPQDIALFNDSIAYNIGFGRQDSTEADIVRAAKVAHVHEFIVGLPDGYKTKVGERGLRLSGGQKQRIAIARAAIKKPKIFVFDEATSSLDSKTERAILHNLVKTAETATTLVIAHRLSTIIHANKIIVLDNGQVVECGTHSELLSLGNKYATMWEAQHSRGYNHITLASDMM